ncbi:hypothetical protein BV22DRAFT_1126217 [Leucogyrophana mollusca]|uniref:Uncharacterized protein n=1 Tax=Leucogyrophana mollusca TaxID=85980 RepID=A0ACB8BVH6_9AGAM|nr:hypothetical protein BV22DRAFT_1126217 [Leucogyrophana mollusca]
MASVDDGTVLESIYFDNCFTIVIITVLCYDYVLAFPTEVEFVWKRPLSLTSSLYFLIRYPGLTVGIVNALWGNIINKSTSYVSFSLNCDISSDWLNLDVDVQAHFYSPEWFTPTSLKPRTSLPVVMSMRICAIYNRSKMIFGVLSAFFLLNVVSSITIVLFYSHPLGGGFVTQYTVLGASYCAEKVALYDFYYEYLLIPRVWFDVLLLILVIAPLIRSAINMHRALGRWKPNVYLRELAQGSVLYFALHLAYTLADLIIPLRAYPSWSEYLGMSISGTVPYMLAPRLILSLRHFHAEGYSGAVHSGIPPRESLSTVAHEHHEMHFIRPSPHAIPDEEGESYSRARDVEGVGREGHI